jgi:hypothetical protein
MAPSEVPDLHPLNLGFMSLQSHENRSWIHRKRGWMYPITAGLLMTRLGGLRRVWVCLGATSREQGTECPIVALRYKERPALGIAYERPDVFRPFRSSVGSSHQQGLLREVVAAPCGATTLQTPQTAVRSLGWGTEH